MKPLALVVVAGVMMLALAIAIFVYEPDAGWASEYLGLVGAAIATAAVLASIVLQIRSDQSAPAA